MNATAEWREHADAPVAKLVAAALDDYGSVVGYRVSRVVLIAEELEQVFGSVRDRDRVLRRAE